MNYASYNGQSRLENLLLIEVNCIQSKSSLGNLLPSEQDKRLVRRMVEIGKASGHVILGREGYYSFADEGEL